MSKVVLEGRKVNVRQWLSTATGVLGGAPIRWRPEGAAVAIGASIKAAHAVGESLVTRFSAIGVVVGGLVILAATAAERITDRQRLRLRRESSQETCDDSDRECAKAEEAPR